MQESRSLCLSSSLGRVSSRLGLQGKLILLVLLVLVPLATLDVVQIYGRFEDRIEQELQADQDFAHAISVAFANFVQSTWDEELAVGGSIVHGGNPVAEAQAKSVLAEHLAIHAGVKAFSWVPSNGATVITASRPGWVAPNQAGSNYMERILAGEGQLVSDLLENPAGTDFSLAISRAIYRNGHFMGSVVAYLDPLYLEDAVPVDRPGSSTFSLVDRNGLIVYSRDVIRHAGRPGIPASSDSPALIALKGRPVVTKQFHSTLDGTPRMGAAVPVPALGWAAVASTPTKDVLAAPLRETARDLAFLILVWGASLAGAILLGRWVLRPLVTLQTAATAISRGDLAARVGYNGADELGQTARVFDQMAGQIQALIAQREQFLQVAAHELRNPMTSVKGMLSLARHRMAVGRPMGDLERLTEVMEQEIDRLSGLLNEILEAFRIHDGRLTLRFEPLNLAELVESALEPFRVSAEAHRFNMELPEGSVWVRGDRGRLEEVLRNLYGNAVKYSPDGGEIDVRLEVAAGHATVSVRDNGMGIPPDQLTKIFEGFYRATNVPGHDPGGLGLGLFICQDIVTRHQGEIWAESTEGQGSAFFVQLPLLRNEEESSL